MHQFNGIKLTSQLKFTVLWIKFWSNFLVWNTTLFLPLQFCMLSLYNMVFKMIFQIFDVLSCFQLNFLHIIVWKFLSFHDPSKYATIILPLKSNYDDWLFTAVIRIQSVETISLIYKSDLYVSTVQFYFKWHRLQG